MPHRFERELAADFDHRDRLETPAAGGNGLLHANRLEFAGKAGSQYQKEIKQS